MSSHCMACTVVAHETACGELYELRWLVCTTRQQFLVANIRFSSGVRKVCCVSWRSLLGTGKGKQSLRWAHNELELGCVAT